MRDSRSRIKITHYQTFGKDFDGIMEKYSHFLYSLFIKLYEEKRSEDLVNRIAKC